MKHRNTETQKHRNTETQKHRTLKAFSTLVLTLCLTSTAHATLMAVSIGGGTNNAVYDNVLDITWLANANLAASNTFGVSGIDASGFMNWNTANEWTTAMNASNGGLGYLGVKTWRQPEVNPVNGTSFNTTFTYDGSTDTGFQLSAPRGTIIPNNNPNNPNNPNGQSPGFTGSELAYHYYNNLDAVGARYGTGTTFTTTLSNSVSGVDDSTNSANLALFSNILNPIYWTDTEVAAGSVSGAFLFRTNNGSQVTLGKNNSAFVWAVAPGNVAAVPVPAAVWLMGSALLGLAGFRRRRAGTS